MVFTGGKGQSDFAGETESVMGSAKHANTARMPDPGDPPEWAARQWRGGASAGMVKFAKNSVSWVAASTKSPANRVTRLSRFPLPTVAWDILGSPPMLLRAQTSSLPTASPISVLLRGWPNIQVPSTAALASTMRSGSFPNFTSSGRGFGVGLVARSLRRVGAQSVIKRFTRRIWVLSTENFNGLMNGAHDRFLQ